MESFSQITLDRFTVLHKTLIEALEGLPQEALDWSPGPDFNSITRLIVHLTGAERFLFGDLIMGQPTGRDRDLEFQAEGWSAEQLAKRIYLAEETIAQSLGTLALADLEAGRNHPKHNTEVPVGFAVLHALEHSAEHLGEVKLLRRMWEQKS